MMRYVLACVALALACLAAVQGHSTRGQIQIIEQVLEENEIVAAEDEYENAVGRPSYVPRTRICTWSRDDGSDAVCRYAPRTEYRDEGTCLYTEWGAIEMLAAEGRRQGIKLNASVSCVAEYDA